MLLIRISPTVLMTVEDLCNMSEKFGKRVEPATMRKRIRTMGLDMRQPWEHEIGMLMRRSGQPRGRRTFKKPSVE